MLRLQALYTVDELSRTFGLSRNEVLPAIWQGELRVSACGAQGWEVSQGDLASWVHCRNGNQEWRGYDKIDDGGMHRPVPGQLWAFD